MVEKKKAINIVYVNKKLYLCRVFNKITYVINWFLDKECT